MNISTLLDENVQRFGEYDSVFYQGKWISNVEMHQTANRLSNLLSPTVLDSQLLRPPPSKNYGLRPRSLGRRSAATTLSVAAGALVALFNV